MGLVLISFLAGILTVLSPCVLPILPVVIGGSLTSKYPRQPLIIAIALAVSLFVFTLLLKTVAVFAHIPEAALMYFSGGLVILLGVAMLWPEGYQGLLNRFKFETSAQQNLQKSVKNKSFWRPIFIGLALGPVFSSCSPVYAYILATVLPVRFGVALIYLASYILGLAGMLLLIAYGGRQLVAKFKFASNPRGWFQRALGILFIIVGLLVATGYNQQVEVWVANHTGFDISGYSSGLLPTAHPTTADDLFNVVPYAAPDFAGIQDWINSQPLTMTQLKGKVVLVDFWTYSCINCIRNNVYLEKWYDAYKNDGLVIVGVSAPEFSFEKIESNVQDAVKKQGITYPVALDSNLETWAAYNNQYWPDGYLIDASGEVRREDSGEGDYNQTEQAIRTLLQQNGAKLSNTLTTNGSEIVPISANQTNETYFGTDREQAYVGTPTQLTNGNGTFTAATANALQPGEWTLGGTWNIDSDGIISAGHSTLTINVSSKDTYLVAGASTPEPVTVLYNGAPVGGEAGSDVSNSVVNIGESQLYHLIANSSFVSNYLITLEVPSGVKLNTFTFGS